MNQKLLIVEKKFTKIAVAVHIPSVQVRQDKNEHEPCVRLTRLSIRKAPPVIPQQLQQLVPRWTKVEMKPKPHTICLIHADYRAIVPSSAAQHIPLSACKFQGSMASQHILSTPCAVRIQSSPSQAGAPASIKPKDREQQQYGRAKAPYCIKTGNPLNRDFFIVLRYTCDDGKSCSLLAAWSSKLTMELFEVFLMP